MGFLIRRVPGRRTSIFAGLVAALLVLAPVAGARHPQIRVGVFPTGIAVDSATGTVYVGNGTTDTLSLIDGATCNARTTVGCGQRVAAVTAGFDPIGVAVERVDEHDLRRERLGCVGGRERPSLQRRESLRLPRAARERPGREVPAVPRGRREDPHDLRRERRLELALGDRRPPLQRGLDGGLPPAEGHDPARPRALRARRERADRLGLCHEPRSADPLCDRHPALQRRRRQRLRAGARHGERRPDAGRDRDRHPTNTIYVTGETSNDVSVIDGKTCNGRDQQGCIRKPFRTPAGLGARGIAVDEQTETVYVANTGANTVSVIDAATCNGTVHSGCGRRAVTAPVGSSPRRIAVDEATNTIYVTNAFSNTVTMLDGRTCSSRAHTGCREPLAAGSDTSGKAEEAEDLPRLRLSARRFGWPRVESNHRSQLRRLPLCPLSYGAVERWRTGLEPATTGTTTRGSTN